jgi:response regulator RpfG family c-di-GMP phosphodiesterase
MEYIRDLSGKQFDPQVVDVFCKMVDNNEINFLDSHKDG